MLELEVVSPLDTWGRSIRAHLPSANDDAILEEFRGATHEFLRRSLSLQHTVEIALTEGESTYSINPIASIWSPADTPFGGVTGIYVLELRIGEDYVPLLNFKPLRANRFSPSPPTKFYAWSPSQGKIELFPTPVSEDTGRVLEVYTALVLQSPVSSVPRFLADYYYDALLSGTLGRMHNQVKRPYHSASSAQYHLRKFQNEIAMARSEATRRWSRAEVSFHVPPSWGSNISGHHRT